MAISSYTISYLALDEWQVFDMRFLRCIDAFGYNHH